MAEGRVVIPRNVVGRARPLGIGEGLRVKVNANVGSSKDRADLEQEVRKARIAVQVDPHRNSGDYASSRYVSSSSSS